MKFHKQCFIIAIDVGFRNTGIALYSITKNRFIRFYHIPTELDETARYKVWDNLRCCRFIYAEILNVLQNVGLDKIKVIAAELPTGAAQSARANSAMGMSVAIVACVLEELRHRKSAIKFEPISPLEIKRLVRKGKVSKQDIQKLIEKRYGKILPEKAYIREHVADAAACIEVLKAKFSPKFFQ
jgi:hypothetical protein